MALIERKRKTDAGIDMTPLIDVVFQLLVFLMVSVTFMKPEALVDLPQAPGQARSPSVEGDKVSIVIFSDNRVEVDGVGVLMEDLGRVLAERGASLEKRRAEIRGDGASDLETFVKVMEIARAEGFDSLSLVKQHPDTE